jgi:hypothetical protein
MIIHDMGIFSMDAFWCLCYYGEGDFQPGGVNAMQQAAAIATLISAISSLIVAIVGAIRLYLEYKRNIRFTYAD